MLRTALVLWQHAYLDEGEVQSMPRMLISIKQLIFFSFHPLQERFLRWIKPWKVSPQRGNEAHWALQHGRVKMRRHFCLPTLISFR